MRFTPILAALAAALFAVPAAAQDPIAQSIEMFDNFDGDNAREVLDAACKGGNAEACWRLALALSMDFSDEAGALADKQFLANCAKGDARSCYMINRRVAYDADDKEKAKGVTALRKACDGGLAYACNDLANAISYQGDETEGPTPAQKKEMAALYEKACSLGSRAGCHSAADSYGSTYDNPLLDITKAISLEIKACDMGGDEACANVPNLERAALGDTLANVEQRKRWQGFRKRSCELGDSSVCEAMLKEELFVP